jgi:hypothetical protein
MSKLIFSILVILISSIFVVFFLLKPDGIHPPSFWGYLFWLSTLIVLNWWVSSAIFGEGSQNKRIMGVLPSLALTIFIYSALSILMVCINLFGNVFTNNYHLVSQIILALIGSIVCILLLITAKVTEISSINKISKGELIRGLTEIKLTHNFKENNSLDELIFHIRYHMPHDKYIENNVAADLQSNLKKLQKTSDLDEIKEIIEILLLTAKKNS